MLQIKYSPIYVISKGRSESRLTVRALEKMGANYFVVIEQSEYKDYSKVIDPRKILILPEKYFKEYDIFMDIGKTSSTGSGPARNFVWDHAKASGAKWHWIMDDNIRYFGVFNNNLKVRADTPVIFTAMESFCNRYKNIALAGPNYFMFIPRKNKQSPFIPNTRIYSCLLIRNDIPFRWRGRYNEDTDLSLRVLKAGYCTILFNTFFQYKMTTQTVKGGNEEIYKHGTLEKSQMIVKMHPDVARLSWRFNRWHHFVDYTPFKYNKLIKVKNIDITNQIDNFGLKLRKIK